MSPRGGDDPAASGPTHSPTVFIRTWAPPTARAAGRSRSWTRSRSIRTRTTRTSRPSSGTHPNTTKIALADYDKLVAMLGEAFDGTAQPAPRCRSSTTSSASRRRSPAKKSHYTGSSRQRRGGLEAKQAAYYRQAIEAGVLPAERQALFLFHASTRPNSTSWQSGRLLRRRDAEGEPRRRRGPRWRLSRRGVSRVRRHCGSPHGRSRSAARRLTITCDLGCTYVAQLSASPAGCSSRGRGQAIGDQADDTAVRRPGRNGRYRFGFRVSGEPGPADAATPARPAGASIRPWKASTSPTGSTGSIRPGAACRSRSVRGQGRVRGGVEAFAELRAPARVLATGVRPDWDFFLWKITDRYEALGELGAALNATPLAGWLETPYSYLATTKASQYTSARSRGRSRRGARPTSSSTRS